MCTTKSCKKRKKDFFFMGDNCTNVIFLKNKTKNHTLSGRPGGYPDDEFRNKKNNNKTGIS